MAGLARFELARARVKVVPFILYLKIFKITFYRLKWLFISILILSIIKVNQVIPILSFIALFSIVVAN